MPFEGTGAISLDPELFQPGGAARSITDIIVHMRYTAKSR
ncbi:hypothetical protein HG619_13320 [Pseudomonas syringae]|nr:hypothetical protein [Pseudomonas syringae]